MTVSLETKAGRGYNYESGARAGETEHGSLGKAWIGAKGGTRQWLKLIRAKTKAAARVPTHEEGLVAVGRKMPRKTPEKHAGPRVGKTLGQG